MSRKKPIRCITQRRVFGKRIEVTMAPAKKRLFKTSLALLLLRVPHLMKILWNWIEQVDWTLFKWINSGAANSLFDHWLPLWRTAEFWVPLYLFLTFFVWLNFRQKAGWWMLYLFVTVSAMDMAGNHLIKQWVQRIRPCNDPSLYADVILRLPHCGTGYSFISNHAANHFALASFLFLTIGKLMGRWRGILFLWAFSIGFSQIYVGVHYPTDVLGGALVGLMAGWLGGTQFNKRHQLPIFEEETMIHS